MEMLLFAVVKRGRVDRVEAGETCYVEVQSGSHNKCWLCGFFYDESPSSRSLCQIKRLTCFAPLFPHSLVDYVKFGGLEEESLGH